MTTIAASASKDTERKAAGVAFGAHALHDGYTDLIYVMLPVWQAEFGIGFAALGLIKTVFSGTLASFQVPSGMLAERYGTALILAAGTALAGVGYCFAGASSGLIGLVLALFVSGLGASTQHPLASSLITRAFGPGRTMKALGTYNFAGDIGKMTVPAIASLLLVVMPWRHALILLGSVGVLAAIVIYVVIPRLPSPSAADAKKSARGKDGVPAYGFPLLL
jgi:MFS family permease